MPANKEILWRVCITIYVCYTFSNTLISYMPLIRVRILSGEWWCWYLCSAFLVDMVLWSAFQLPGYLVTSGEAGSLRMCLGIQPLLWSKATLVWWHWRSLWEADCGSIEEQRFLFHLSVPRSFTSDENSSRGVLVWQLAASWSASSLQSLGSATNCQGDSQIVSLWGQP